MKTTSYNHLPSADAKDIYHWLIQEDYAKLRLTTIEKNLIDPTGHGAAHLLAMRELPGTPVPVFFACKGRDEWLCEYDRKLDKFNFSPNAAPYVNYNKEMHSKYGEQGRKSSLEHVKRQFEPFYINAKDKRTFKKLKAAVNYLKRHIHELISLYGIPPYEGDPQHGATGTCGGLPTMHKKGQFSTETIGRWFIPMVLPDLAGQRDMRSKRRVINMDATANVRSIENEILSIQNWLKKYLPEYFSAWRNPQEYLQPQIYAVLQRHGRFLMFDYDHCDEHMSFQAFEEVVWPVIQELMTPNQQMRFYRIVYALFHQPLYWGETVWVGLHNLFSGQIITNFLETIFGVVLLLSGIIEFDISRKQVTLGVCGDDLYLGLIKVDRATEKALAQYIITASNEAAMVMNADKCAAEDYLIFLRRVYYTGLPVEYTTEGKAFYRGAYPSVLTLNNTINPEYYMSCDDPDWFAAFFSRLDVMYGSPEFNLVVEMLVKHLSTLPTPDELRAHTFTDWWYKLYGERWDPMTSPSYAIARRVLA